MCKELILIFLIEESIFSETRCCNYGSIFFIEANGRFLEEGLKFRAVILAALFIELKGRIVQQGF